MCCHGPMKATKFIPWYHLRKFLKDKTVITVQYVNVGVGENKVAINCGLKLFIWIY